MSPTRNARLNTPVVHALFLIAILSISTGTSAQNTYKCGNVYSATPCPGGVAIDTQDTRTSAQKTQSEAATAKTAKTGDAMEKSRLIQEQVVAKERAMAAGSGASVISAQSAATDAGDQSTKLDAAKKKKKKAPEFFTAQVPGEKKVKVKTKAKKETQKDAKAKKPAAATSAPAAVKP